MSWQRLCYRIGAVRDLFAAQKLHIAETRSDRETRNVESPPPAATVSHLRPPRTRNDHTPKSREHLQRTACSAPVPPKHAQAVPAPKKPAKATPAPKKTEQAAPVPKKQRTGWTNYYKPFSEKEMDALARYVARRVTGQGESWVEFARLVNSAPQR